MASPVALPKNLIILGIVLPLAVLLGVMLADPMDRATWVFGALLLGAMVTPILLRWHHPLLIVSWNSGMLLALLPGDPQLWVILAGVSLGLTTLHCLLDKEKKFLHVHSLTWTLLILALVVVVTAEATGGMGVRSFGGTSFGGKKYYYILFAVLAYFALSGQSIPREKAQLYLGMFLLSSVGLAISNVVYEAGPGFYWLYLFFPIDYAVSQAMEDLTMTTSFSRWSGVTSACIGAFFFMHMRYGIRGIFDLRHWWRLAVWIGIILLSLSGGFRSAIIIFGMLFSIQYVLEGLFRSRITLILLIFGVFSGTILLSLSDKLPMSMQRAISFLPVDVNPAARADAQASTDWRLRMWKVLVPEIPRYLFKGKGYTASPTDYYLATESAKRGLAEDIEVSLIAGDYHNGPLSVIIPFGIWGMLAFLAFLGFSLKVLLHNHRHGDPELANINLFLLAAFITRALFYLAFFGAISSDLTLFCGLVGISVSLNRGLAGVNRQQESAAQRAQEAPAPA